MVASSSINSLNLSGDSDSPASIQLAALDIPIAFCIDLSEMETATQPIVTAHAKLQNIAYPALLQRRKRMDEEALMFFVFTRIAGLTVI